jgi:choline dehydrogenase-like flavoprotein
MNSFDAIVVGSGISGGWAAKELCDKGLKTLLLERGRQVEHLKDYPTATSNPWDLKHRGRMDQMKRDNPIVGKCYALDEATEHFFVKDDVHPYVQDKPFDWIRGYQVGGKSLIWARQTQRWSAYDFDAPARDGAAAWPFSYKELAPWYSHVERFAGISGNRDGLDTLPDSEFLPPFEMNCVEKKMSDQINTAYQDRRSIHGRCAHLTKPAPIHAQQGRNQCQARHLCYRGCPFGAYFSSNSSTLPWAMRTGNLTLQPNSVVHSVIYDSTKEKVTGVRVVDTETKKVTEYFAKIIFLNAACLNTNLIALNSTSSRFPNGLGNDNGLLGKYMAFHNYRGTLTASFDGFEDKYYFGRTPTQLIVPNFRNVGKQEMEFQRGYMTHYSAGRGGWQRGLDAPGIGASFKDQLTEPGGWHVYMMMQGEHLPMEKDRVYLHKELKDAWGVPQLVMDIDYNDNDEKILKDFFIQGAEMLEKSGCSNIQQHDSKQSPGLDIHEMGGIRMGNDPKTSLLNKWNQFHHASNVFVTDGACMVSTSTQNPSLTFMAITARAADHAVSELKKGNI